jgi:hypothetical protein
MPADPGCSSPSDNNESTPHPTLSLTSNKLVRGQTSATLSWSGTNIESGSCTLSGDNGDSWTLAGTSGTKTTSHLTNETSYTLRCLDLLSTATSTMMTVFIAPDSGER